MSSLFERFGGRQLSNPAPAQSTPDGNFISQNLPAIQNDPVGVLRQVGLNVPANMTPKGMADYLIQSGQISNGELSQVINTARMMGVRI